MAKDYGQRGEAAMRLMKKGQPPMEDDLGLPPEDEAMPPEEAGGGMGGIAALLQGAGGGAPEEAPMEEAPPEEGGGPPMEAAGPPDLDTALGGVEGALEGMPPEVAEEIRVHLNAIRELAAQGAPPMEPPMEAPPAEGAMPLPDGGASGGAMNEEEV